MTTLFTQENFISMLGHNLEIGNLVSFTSCGMNLIGRIVNFENGKCVINTIGCQYKTPEELELIKSKAKKKYKVNPKKCILRTTKK